MRKLTHLFILFLAACLAAWVHTARSSLPEVNPLQPSKLDQAKLALLAQAKPSRAFVLTQSLEFPLEGRQDVRLASTANISGLANIDAARKLHLANPAKRWDYALTIELLDAQGKVLQQRDYHHSANLLELQRKDGHISASAFYVQSELTPLSTEVSSLNLQEFPQAKRLRVRLAQLEPSLFDVVLRIYQSRPDSEQDSNHRWQRLSPQQQAELARGSVHGKILLDAQEKKNLLRNTRLALGPLGQEGRDYQVRDIYILFENEGEVRRAPIAAYGLQLDNTVYGMVPLPAAGGKLRLEFQAAPEALASDEKPTAAEIALRWYGTGLFQKSSTSFTWHGGAQQHELTLAGGLLEIVAPRAATVRAYLTPNDALDGKEIEITPVPQYERVFIASKEQAVSYAMGEVDSQSGLRLTVRQFQAGSLRATSARYEAFDAQGQSLGRGQLPISAKLGHYERVVGDYSQQEAKLASSKQAANLLSEPAVGFFLLPPKTSNFKVWANDSDLLVTAHTRPYALARELRLPEDNYSYDAQGKRIPAWFLLHPEQEEHMLANQRSRQLLVQAQPLPETIEQEKILQGAFQWTDYRPQGQWLARPIYTARESQVPYREDVLPSMFTPIAASGSRLQFPRYQGLSNLPTTLVWQGSSQPQHAQIFLDGKMFTTLEVRAAYAEINLPPLAAGTHQLQLKGGNSGQWYINHAVPNASSVMRRVAQRFQNELVFDYHRTSLSAETLSARLYQVGTHSGTQTSAQNPAKLSISIAGPAVPTLQPLSAWLFTDRIATVQASRERSKVFDTDGQQADGGSPIFLPFPADAPLGHYKIRIRLLDSAKQQHYLSLSRLSSALATQSRLHHQPESNHAQVIE